MIAIWHDLAKEVSGLYCNSNGRPVIAPETAANRFKKRFLKMVQSCSAANLIHDETTQVDAALICADVSWTSLATKHACGFYDAILDYLTNRLAQRKKGRICEEILGKTR